MCGYSELSVPRDYCSFRSKNQANNVHYEARLGRIIQDSLNNSSTGAGSGKECGIPLN
jgi:hypothetical protein